MNIPKKPIIIIQFSCDPYHDNDLEFDTTIETKRIKSDKIARHNALRILKMAPKRQRVGQTVKDIEKSMETNLKQEGLFEEMPLTPRKKQTIKQIRLSSSMRSTNATIDAAQFYRTLKNPNTHFYYLPIHAAHPKDFDNLQIDEYFIKLAEKMYIVTVTPMNSKGLFFNNDLEDKLFFEYLSNTTGYTRIFKERHKNILSRLLYNSLRIWGPGDVLLNREIQPDRHHHPLQRKGRHSTERLPRAIYRNSLNRQVSHLYNDLAKTQKLKKTQKGGSLHYKLKVKDWIKHSGNKYSHNKNKLGYRDDCSGFVSFVWGINPGPYGGAYTNVQSNNHITSYAKEITKDKLRFGDAIYIYNKHIILFDKWTNKEHTHYYAYQMCNRGNCRGLTHKIIPFPFSEFRKPNENHYKLLRYNM